MKRTTKRPTPKQACNTILRCRPMKRCKLEATVVLVDYQDTEHWTCEVCALRIEDWLSKRELGGGA